MRHGMVVWIPTLRGNPVQAAADVADALQAIGLDGTAGLYTIDDSGDRQAALLQAAVDRLAENGVLPSHPVVIDLPNRQVRAHGRPVVISDFRWPLFEMLVRRNGRTATPAEIAQAAYGENTKQSRLMGARLAGELSAVIPAELGEITNARKHGVGTERRDGGYRLRLNPEALVIE